MDIFSQSIIVLAEGAKVQRICYYSLLQALQTDFPCAFVTLVLFLQLFKQ